MDTASWILSENPDGKLLKERIPASILGCQIILLEINTIQYTRHGKRSHACIKFSFMVSFFRKHTWVYWVSSLVPIAILALNSTVEWMGIFCSTTFLGCSLRFPPLADSQMSPALCELRWWFSSQLPVVACSLKICSIWLHGDLPLWIQSFYCRCKLKGHRPVSATISLQVLLFRIILLCKARLLYRLLLSYLSLTSATPRCSVCGPPPMQPPEVSPGRETSSSWGPPCLSSFSWES